jgi:hypothetical protein
MVQTIHATTRNGGWRSMLLIGSGLFFAIIAPRHDVFPFSVQNQSMTSERVLGCLWGWINAQRLRKGRLRFTGDLILLRNILYTAVSADRRYGPIYN